MVNIGSISPYRRGELSGKNRYFEPTLRMHIFTFWTSLKHQFLNKCCSETYDKRVGKVVLTVCLNYFTSHFPSLMVFQKQLLFHALKFFLLPNQETSYRSKLLLGTTTSSSFRQSQTTLGRTPSYACSSLNWLCLLHWKALAREKMVHSHHWVKVLYITKANLQVA